MHELGLCESIVNAVEARAGKRPVARVRVRVGSLHHVHPEAFDQSFAVAAAGGVAEDAAAELVLVPASGTCGSCGRVFDTEDAALACPTCGGIDIAIDGGDELTLELIEYRPVPEPPLSAAEAGPAGGG